MKKFITALSLLGLFGLVSFAGSSGPISSQGFATVALPVSTTTSQHWITPLFDPSLGTLIEVRLESTLRHGRFLGQESECDNPNPLTFDYHTHAETVMYKDNQALLTNVDIHDVQLTTYGPYDGNTDFYGVNGTSGAARRALYSRTQVGTITDPALLTQFIGQGNMDLVLLRFATGNYDIVDGSGCSGGYTNILRYKFGVCEYRIRYYYTTP